MVVEGDCAPSYLEVLLSPLGAYRLLGLPMAELSGQLVDLVEVLGADGRRLGRHPGFTAFVFPGQIRGTRSQRAPHDQKRRPTCMTQEVARWSFPGRGGWASPSCPVVW